ncbi:pyruvate kinase [Herbaspirillum sp. GCM10030257]|uniref:pyruvate kinase n=1 Tax=Herbaspirillum sp. GCM10030257 TaxID=3273393 RepID=UPI00360AC34F
MCRNRNLKIVATLGASTGTPQEIKRLFDAGADVFRIDLARDSRNDHRKLIEAVRQAEAEIGRPLGIMLDLQGPTMRIGGFRQSGVELVTGQGFRFDLSPGLGDHNRVCLPYPAIYASAQAGGDVYLDEGAITLRIETISEDAIHTRVLSGGRIHDGQEIKIPHVRLHDPVLTEKDLDDLSFGLSMDVEWMALSLVQSKLDLLAFHRQIDGKGKTHVIAKIECREALEHLEEIVAEADAVMIVREALSVELPMEDVLVTQRAVVRECRAQGKPVIAATQMLDSMEHRSLPVAAEASHVASAVYDGIDAVVLSSETASGKYATEAIAAIDRIAQRVERDATYDEQVHGHFPMVRAVSATEAISAAVRGIAELLPLCFTAAYTFSGSTCLAVAKARPRSPILGLSPSLDTARMLSLVWGVYPIHSAASPTVENMLDDVFCEAKEAGFTESGRPFVIVAGMPFGTPGSTNLMRIAWT